MGLARGLVLIAGIAAVLIAGSTASMAATVTVNFSGTIKNIVDPTGVTTYSNNDVISGVLTIGPLGDAPSTNLPPPAAHSVYSGAASLDFTPLADTGQATLATQNIVSSLGYFGINFTSATSGLLIDFTVSNPTAVPLQTLGNLPTDLNGILAYLGGTLISKNASIYGGPDAAHQFSLSFTVNTLNLSVSSVATTPVPAALLLFVTALGGLGFVVRRTASEERSQA